MPKTSYLIIFLSVLLFKSETSFGQGLKKELGICGKTMSALYSNSEPSGPLLGAVKIRDEEFCDQGRYEHNANYVISLYNAKEQLVYDKHVYLNPHTFQESLDQKNTGAITKTKVASSGNSRIVKFPVTKEMGQVTFFRIESLEDKKKSEMKKINW